MTMQQRTVVAELRAGGCTEEEISPFLEVEQVSLRRERARRAERLVRTLGAAVARFTVRVVLWPAELLIPGR